MQPAVSPNRSVLRAAWRLVDRHAILLMAAVALLVLPLNWQAASQQGMTRYFYDFRDVIRGGFDPALATRAHVPTFPMWGYGWLLLLTDSKIVLLLIQNALGVTALALLLRCVQRIGLIERNALTALKLLAVLAVPWHAFNSITWPGSIAASLIVCALALLPDAIGPGPILSGRAILSGVLLGIAANFRPDALLVAIALLPVLAAAVRFKPKPLCRLAIWLGCAYVLMVPWLLYTRAVTGRALLTSTNGGLTALTGFGHLPDNRWGITLSDEDPKIASIIQQRLGRPASPVSFEADQVLKQQFKTYVLADPMEYLRKCAKTLFLHVTKGAYPGEFFCWCTPDWEDAQPYYLDLRARLLRDPIATIRRDPGHVLLVLLSVATSATGRIVLLLSFCLLPITVVHALRTRQAILLATQVIIVYTALTVAMLANADARFATPAYPYHLLNLVVGLTAVGSALRRLLRPSAEPPPACSPDSSRLC